MKQLSEIISEKLNINKNSAVSIKHNEEVLILLAKNYKYPLGLFIYGLKAFKEQFDVDDIICSYNVSSENDIYMSFYYNHHLDISINSNKTLTINCVPETGKNAISSKNVVNKLINSLNTYTAKFTTFEIDSRDYLMMPKKWLYMWYSKSNKVIRIYISDEEYKNLLDDGVFDD